MRLLAPEQAVEILRMAIRDYLYAAGEFQNASERGPEDREVEARNAYFEARDRLTAAYDATAENDQGLLLAKTAAALWPGPYVEHDAVDR